MNHKELLMRVGVDVGGTRIKAGLVDGQGTVHGHTVQPVPVDRSAESVATIVAELVCRFAEDAKTMGGSVQVVGIGAAGILDQAKGVIRESPNFPLWKDAPLGVLISEQTDLPYWLDNDANAVLYGEFLAGAGRGAENMIGMTLGTGVGGAIILQGRVWRGARGMAGELGHVTVVPDGRLCACGNHGCLEQYAGAVGIRATLRSLGLSQLADAADVTEQCARRARLGEEPFVHLFEDIGGHIGLAFASFVHGLDITRLVVAGGLAGSADLFLPTLTQTIHSRTYRSMSQGVEIRVGELGDHAGIIGAAALASLEIASSARQR